MKKVFLFCLFLFFCSSVYANWASTSAGGYHTVAIKQDGTLWVWGNNGNGQLGLGDTIDRNTPTQVNTTQGGGSNYFTISGTVYDLYGNGLDKAEVRCYKANTGEFYTSVFTASSGYYSLTVEGYADYRIVVYSLQYEFSPVEVLVYVDSNFVQDFYATREINRPEENKFIVCNNVIKKGSGEYMTIRTNPSGEGDVSVKIYTLTGQHVDEWWQHISPQNPDFTWDGKDGNGNYLPHGVYYIVIEGLGIHDKKMVVIRGK